MTEQEAEVKRVISYIRSCRNAGIDTTITIDKSRNHLILNALEEIQQYRALEEELNKYQTNIDLKTLLNYFIETIFKGEEHKRFCILTNEDAEKWDAYNALGTVEEIKSKIEELKRWHSDHIIKEIKNEFANTSTLICHNCDHKDEYIIELEAELEELREAREKQVPKKAVFVHPIQLNDGGDYMCPTCKTGTILNAYGGKSKYCPWCGQAIDWS